MALYQLLERPELESPVLVLALDGWVDAGFAAQTARTALMQVLEPVTVATFDTDELLDHRARRPVLHLADGLLTGVSWPELELQAASDRAGNDVLLLVGSEPDLRWRAFTGAVIDLAMEFGTRLVVGLGAYPAPVPHTRVPRLASSASDEHLARFCSIRPTVDVPTGVQGAIERRAAEVGLPAIGLWVQVPHYASAIPNPAAAAALLDGLALVSGLRLDTEGLHREAVGWRARIDDLVAANPDHVAMVQRLESAWDAEESGSSGAFDIAGNLPSGEELAAEVERFLREQGPGT